MTEDKKMQDNSIEDTLSSIKNIVEDEVVTSSQPVLDLTETEMVSTSEKSTEELIDIKQFDQTGELSKADDNAQLVAKAQHGDDSAIAAFSQSLKDEPVSAPVAEETSSQDDIDSLLNNIGQVAEESNIAQTPEDLSSKAEMLESASKTYAGKDFTGSEEYTGEDDIDETEEAQDEPQEASFDELAAAMAQQTIPKVEKKIAQSVTSKVALKAVPGATGLQVGFPIEVLAEALRPMIADWVEENLPTIVEKLVKEELSKLADK